MIDLDATTLVACRDAFAEAITLRPAAGGSIGVAGIVQLPTARQQVEADGGPAWVIASPSVGLRVADLSSMPAKNDLIVARGVTYRITEVLPDAVGWVNILMKATV